jgi:DNA ligase (NAD+)
MDLILVDEIKIAKSVLEFFDNEENKIIIDRLKITVYNLKLLKTQTNATDKLVVKHLLCRVFSTVL